MNAPSPDDLFAEYLRGGEPARFADLHDLLRDELQRVAERLAPDRTAAEDLVQATFLGALESAGRFRRGSKVVPWLFGILQNQARMMRWRQRRTPDPRRLAWPEPRDPAELAADRELDQALASAFARLGPTYAPVMELHLCADLSAQDIGKRLDRPAGTVRTQVVRGTAMLRSLLPAGLASLLLVRVSPALDAASVRDLLLEHAARGRVVTTSWFGAKALQLGAAALVVAAVTWLVVATSAAGADPGAPRVLAREEAGAGDRVPDAPVASSTGSTTNAPVERSLVAGPATGRLTVVVTAFDAPVAAMPVCLFGFDDPRFRRVTALTDAAGTAVLDDVPGGRWLVLPTRARSARTAAMVEMKEGERREHRVVLDDVATFEGHVVDEHGAPIAGAQVWGSDESEHTTGFGSRLVSATGGDGPFTLAMCPQHKVRTVQVTAPGRRASALQRLPERRDERHTFVLAPDGGAVLGQVVDTAGSPIAGVLVRAVHAGERSNLVLTTSDGTNVSPPDTIGTVREVTTGADGRFRIDGFDRGRSVALKAWASEWARCEGTVPADDTGVCTVTMQRGATIHGRVVDQKGKPVAEATVATECFARDDPMRSRVNTDADGRYTLAGVTPGDAVAVTISSRPDPRGRGGAGEATTALRLEPGRTVEWNATLAPGSAFRGTLAMSDGMPFDGWTFGLVAIDEVDGTNHFPVQLGKAGEFDVKNLPRARYWLQCSHGNCMLLQYVISWPPAERYDIVVPAHIARRTIDRCNEAVSGSQGHETGTVDVHDFDHSVVGSYVFAIAGDGSRQWIGGGLGWKADRSCWSAALAPGDYELAIFSTQWSRDELATADQVIPFTIAANRTTALRAELRPGVRRCFRIEEASPHLGADGGFGEVHDASGKLISRWRIPRWYEPAPGTFEASVALAPGRYRLSVETDLGHRGSLDFTVDALVPFADVLPLPVR